MNAEALYYVHAHVVPTAMALLPGRLNTLEARAMLLAVGLQESGGFRYRMQQPHGPAHGYWQFEKLGGVTQVLANAGTSTMLTPALHVLNYPPDVAECYAAIAHNDTLACCFARLLLWTVPGALPQMLEVDKAWQQYLAAWRPGKPRPATWSRYYTEAWRTVVHE